MLRMVTNNGEEWQMTPAEDAYDLFIIAGTEWLLSCYANMEKPIARFVSYPLFGNLLLTRRVLLTKRPQ